jgi:hypothetical protein
MTGGQFNEVTYLTKYFFPNLCNGTYVELGALDGYKFTNTLSLHDRSGWRGVLIEPNPLTFADLAKKRTDELLLGRSLFRSQHLVIPVAPFAYLISPFRFHHPCLPFYPLTCCIPPFFLTSLVT